MGDMKYSIRYKMARVMKKVGANFDPSKNDAVRNMKEVIESLPDASIQFTISHEANGNWIAESVNLSGILTGGNSKDDIQEMIKSPISKSPLDIVTTP